MFHAEENNRSVRPRDGIEKEMERCGRRGRGLS